MLRQIAHARVIANHKPKIFGPGDIADLLMVNCHKSEFFSIETSILKKIKISSSLSPFIAYSIYITGNFAIKGKMRISRPMEKGSSHPL